MDILLTLLTYLRRACREFPLLRQLIHTLASELILKFFKRITDKHDFIMNADQLSDVFKRRYAGDTDSPRRRRRANAPDSNTNPELPLLQPDVFTVGPERDESEGALNIKTRAVNSLDTGVTVNNELVVQNVAGAPMIASAPKETGHGALSYTAGVSPVISKIAKIPQAASYTKGILANIIAARNADTNKVSSDYEAFLWIIDKLSDNGPLITTNGAKALG